MERSPDNGHATTDAATALNDRLSSLEAQIGELRKLCEQYRRDLAFFRTANASAYAERRLDELTTELARIERT